MKLLIAVVVLMSQVVLAQEGSLLERVCETDAYFSAHERSNTHVVVISGQFDPVIHLEERGENAERESIRKFTAYRTDLALFLQEEVENAKRLQSSENPRVIVIAQEYDNPYKELLPRRIEDISGRTPMKELIKQALEGTKHASNVEVVDFKERAFHEERRTRIDTPLFDAVQFVNQAAEAATFSFHVMENNVTGMKMQLDIALAQKVLGLGERSSLNIRTVGNTLMTRIVVPGLLLGLQGLASESKITVTKGTEFLNASLDLKSKMEKMGLQEFAERQTDLRLGHFSYGATIRNGYIGKIFRLRPREELAIKFREGLEISIGNLREKLGQLKAEGQAAVFQHQIDSAQMARQIQLQQMMGEMRDARLNKRVGSRYEIMASSFYLFPLGVDSDADLRNRLQTYVNNPAELAQKIREIRSGFKPKQITVRGR